MRRFGSKVAGIAAARKLAKENPGRVHSGIDKVASAVKGRLPGRHGGAVDRGASMAKKLLTGSDQAPEDRGEGSRRRGRSRRHHEERAPAAERHQPAQT